jgi:hypothetical protein
MIYDLHLKDIFEVVWNNQYESIKTFQFSVSNENYKYIQFIYLHLAFILNFCF